jgi:hypothetical protein
MFTPTHVLISRTKQTPVQLVAGPKGYQLFTEAEWQRGQDPAFELRSKLGLFCRGMAVVGFHLEPITTMVTPADQSQTIAISQ